MKQITSLARIFVALVAGLLVAVLFSVPALIAYASVFVLLIAIKDYTPRTAVSAFQERVSLAQPLRLAA